MITLSQLVVATLFWTFKLKAIRTHSPALENKMEEDWRKLTPAELETLMSPSRFNPTKTSEEVIADYIKKSITSTGVARATIRNELNLRYGSLPSELVDLYGTDLADDSPIFVFIHGGYWQEGTKDIAGGVAVLNHKIGFRTVVFGYTLAPDATIQAMEEELVEALKFVTEMFPKAKLIIAGHSAGGQLAASLLHSPLLPSEIGDSIVAFVLISGVYDLRPLVSTSVNDPLKLDTNEAERLSPLLLPFNDHGSIKLHKIKTLVAVGGLESPEFKRQSLAYYRKLQDKIGDAKNHYYVSTSDDHFTIVENLFEEFSDIYQEVEKFLKQISLCRNSFCGCKLCQ